MKENNRNNEELIQWREELCKLTECRDALSGAELSAAYYAQRPHFQNYVAGVVEKFGVERVNTVLGYTALGLYSTYCGVYNVWSFSSGLPLKINSIGVWISSLTKMALG